MQQQPDPTPAEIAEACAEIRAGWTETERMTSLERTPPMLRADFVGIEAAAAVKAEDRLAATVAAIAASKA